MKKLKPLIVLMTLGLSISACSSQATVQYPIITYDISQMQPERILMECNYIHDIFPEVGSTLDTIKENVSTELGKQCTSASLDKYMMETSVRLNFVENSENIEDYKKDYKHAENVIKNITYCGLQEQMDGSLGYYEYNEGNYLATEITLNVTDFDKAEKIFDLLSNRLSYMYDDVQIYQDSTYWYVQGRPKNPNSIYSYGKVLTIQKLNGYEIWCRYIYDTD